MKLDVLILAGGLGTRLKDVWGGPKCLVPVGGNPLLHRLLDAVAPLRPRIVALALGHRADEVNKWLETLHQVDHDLGGPTNTWPWPFDMSSVIEDKPLGTAGAVRNAVFHSLLGLEAPLLMLNGDTLPQYDLSEFAKFHHTCMYYDQQVTTVTWSQDRLAGGVIIGARKLGEIERSSASNLDEFLDSDCIQCVVSDFLDVGTPEGFKEAQQLKPASYDAVNDGII